MVHLDLFFPKHNIIKYKMLNIHFLKQWMKFMGKQNLILCINIIWVENGGHTYMWCNNILGVDLLWFNPNTTSDFLGWIMNICVRKFSHPYLCIIWCCQFFNLWLYVCLIHCMCIIISKTIYNFFHKLIFFSCKLYALCHAEWWPLKVPSLSKKNK